MNRTEKQSQVDSIRDQFERASLSVVAEFEGIAVAEVTEFRSKLREAEGQFRVVKNSLAKRAVDGDDAQALGEFFKGPVGVVFSYGDPAATAKVVKEFAKGRDGFQVKAGFIEGQLLDAPGVNQIADLPSRDELVARMLRSMNSPISGLATVLAGTVRGLVYTLSAVADKKAA